MTERERFHRDNVPAARRLRGDLTASEALLWSHLRDRRFYGLKFRRQHPVGAFVLDFYCLEMNFAIEVDGDVHREPDVAERDRQRQAVLEERYIQFYRFSASDVEADCESVLRRLTRELGIPGDA